MSDCPNCETTKQTAKVILLREAQNTEQWKQRAKTAEANYKRLLDDSVKNLDDAVKLRETLAEREKELAELRERFEDAQTQLQEFSSNAYTVESLRSRLATAREALTRIASDFETDFVLDGVVVDEPYRMHQVAWEVAKAALAATDDGKEAHCRN